MMDNLVPLEGIKMCSLSEGHWSLIRDRYMMSLHVAEIKQEHKVQTSQTHLEQDTTLHH